MSCSFTNQVIAQLDVEREGLWKVREEGVGAKAPDEKVAALHWRSRSQAHHPHQGPGRHIKIPVEGPTSQPTGTNKAFVFQKYAKMHKGRGGVTFLSFYFLPI